MRVWEGHKKWFFRNRVNGEIGEVVGVIKYFPGGIVVVKSYVAVGWSSERHPTSGVIVSVAAANVSLCLTQDSNSKYYIYRQR